MSRRDGDRVTVDVTGAILDETIGSNFEQVATSSWSSRLSESCRPCAEATFTTR